MGKPTKPIMPTGGTSSYRDDPDAVSLHTTRSDYEYNGDAPELPSYTDSVDPNNTTTTAVNVPPDQYHPISYPPPVSSNWRKDPKLTPSAAVGAETSIRMDESLMDPQNLCEYITNYLRVVPPNPSIRIQGWHWQTRCTQDKKKERERVVDFDFVFSLQQYLHPSPLLTEWWSPRVAARTDKTYRGSWRKSRAPGCKQDIEIGGDDDNTAPDLQDFCTAFADSKAYLKVFRVSRAVTGLDTDMLHEQITRLVRATHYRGHVDVSFPVADRNVDIYSPHWLNRARISWVRWLFYLTFLWIFTWPVLFFMTRWWAVYNVEWRFSVMVDGQQPQQPQQQQQRQRQSEGVVQGRRYAVMSEGAWLSQYTNLISSLVVEKFQGDASGMATDVEPRRAARARGQVGRMPSTGNRNVDTAVGIIQGGLGVWNAVSGREQATGGGWGGDEA